MKNRERIDKVKNYDMVALATDLGYTPVRVSRNFYTLKEHDSLRIKIKNNTYQWYSTGFYGDTISFAMMLGREIDQRFKSFEYAVSFLEKMMENHPTLITIKSDVEERKKDDLVLPRKARDNKKVYYYLHNRRIGVEIIDYFLSNNWLYQENKHNNIVFVSYKDDKPVFVTEKGIIQEERFMREYAGNDYNHCFYIDNDSDTLIITESIVDMMSLMTLDEHYKDYNYLSINSVTKTAAIFHQLDENPNIKKVRIRLDNDEAGINATERISHHLQENYPFVDINVEYPPSEKDWNDYLVYDVNSVEKMNEFTIIF